ncbi:MAG: YqeG family HAD IIIA-type phosphatase [Spirochaetales bacterium]|nr:YqeG family HAD IIIA-type phosphatase [Spirochaetales bacterium]
MFKNFFPYEYVKSVFHIDYPKLFRTGYRGILFDIDNTLVHHGKDSNHQIESLLRYLQTLNFKIVLVSNNSKERIERFIKNIEIPYVDEAMKPHRTGYVKALEILNLEKNQVFCVGDQVFTDIVGSNRCGIASILVEYMRVSNQEKIGKKRQLERFVLTLYSFQRRYQDRMGNVKKEVPFEF